MPPVVEEAIPEKDMSSRVSHLEKSISKLRIPHGSLLTAVGVDDFSSHSVVPDEQKGRQSTIKTLNSFLKTVTLGVPMQLKLKGKSWTISPKGCPTLNSGRWKRTIYFHHNFHHS
jgi:hypothetical protein